MDYFLLNINRNSINYVDEWIKERSIAPIFYGDSTIDKIKNNPKDFPKDATLFVNTFLKRNDDVILFSIGNSKLYIYEQIDIIQEYKEYSKSVEGDLVKGIKIKIREEIEIKECPLVLITIKSNRYMSSGAFRKLKPISEENSYFGNISAIQYFLSKKKKQKVETFKGYLYCLSSLEFETLIAKMFEEKNYFVPAYKGGFIKNYDLFCTNLEDNKTVSLQIKLEMKEKYYNDFTDYYYCINNNYISMDKIRNWESIKNELKECPNTREWLNRTLDWVTFDEKV